ncbi:hypothetical protein [Sphingobacterium faecale]|uniref:XRE family transcriptional regulator n=1 Tax=Sphingobacterium faecale TaxID=2803775 RepID=A0ABS1R7M9_9SPHI|nr:hypothetical protein [Sphingobacterium faecale]MBL1410683.1 hypothetical protein [Sphingobacterium faecale]
MSNIKERVLLIAEYKGVSKTDFFKDLGLSYANFKGIQKMTALNSDAVASILSRYADIEPEWLVTGHGPMLRQGGTVVRDDTAFYQEPVVVNEIEPTLIDALKQVIASQEKTILALEEQIIILKEQRKSQ